MDSEQAGGFGAMTKTATVDGLMKLEQEAYSYNIGGNVCGMEVADFERLMLSAAAHIESLTAERDAAVAAIRDVCDHCGFHGNTSDVQCRKCECQFIAWRGPCAENAPEGAGEDV